MSSGEIVMWDYMRRDTSTAKRVTPYCRAVTCKGNTNRPLHSAAVHGLQSVGTAVHGPSDAAAVHDPSDSTAVHDPSDAAALHDLPPCKDRRPPPP
ncbi:Foot protein 1 variant 1 [Aphis craccivora]|uniref:Foot protein 1 variant 1 n=1 Tax=Aphis craccivora TaxID=307492 RepID=A0A6G0YMT2_APHCR|nr:Foot protein 1 variant 1 [Aphis craccivora]